MAYVSPNFKTKKALKEALFLGRKIDVFPRRGETIPLDGRIVLEGPRAPFRRSWYANGMMKAGRLAKIF